MGAQSILVLLLDHLVELMHLIFHLVILLHYSLSLYIVLSLRCLPIAVNYHWHIVTPSSLPQRWHFLATLLARKELLVRKGNILFLQGLEDLHKLSGRLKIGHSQVILSAFVPDYYRIIGGIELGPHLQIVQ